MREGTSALVGDELDKDLKVGFVLIGCALLLFPVMMDMMQEHDDAVKEHERECDMDYRACLLYTSPSPRD